MTKDSGSTFDSFGWCLDPSVSLILYSEWETSQVKLRGGMPIRGSLINPCRFDTEVSVSLEDVRTLLYLLQWKEKRL